MSETGLAKAARAHLEALDAYNDESCPNNYEAEKRLDATANALRAALDTQPESLLVKRLVDRFLQWPLPKTLSPDGGLSWTPTQYQQATGDMPVGTNLLTADEARQMIEYLLADDDQGQMGVFPRQVKRLQGRPQ